MPTNSRPDAIIYWSDPDDLFNAGRILWHTTAAADIQEQNSATTGTDLGIGMEALHAHRASALQKDSDTNAANWNRNTLTLILPAETALITSVTVPSTKTHHIRAAVPHLLEELVASEPDDLHIAIGEQEEHGVVPLIAIERSITTSALSVVEESELCYSIFVDAQLLAYEPDTLTLVLDGKRALLRWSPHDAGAIEIAALTPVLTAILGQGGFRTVHIFMSKPSNAAIDDWLHADLPPLQLAYALTVEKKTLETDLLGWLHTQLMSEPTAAINLRQGNLAAPARADEQWRRWRPVMYVAAACLIALVVLQIGTGLVLNHRAQTTHERSAALYRELFPQDKRLVNIERQMQSHLGALGDKQQATFWDLFNTFTRALKAPNSEQPMQLRSMSYDATSGLMQIDLVVSNIAIIDALQKQLRVDQLAVKVLSVTNEGSAVVGRLSLTRS